MLLEFADKKDVTPEKMGEYTHWNSTIQSPQLKLRQRLKCFIVTAGEDASKPYVSAPLCLLRTVKSKKESFRFFRTENSLNLVEQSENFHWLKPNRPV